MNDNNFLSQEEIEALLSQNQSGGEEDGGQGEEKESSPGSLENNPSSPVSSRGERVLSQGQSKRPSPRNGKANLNLILDIPLEVSVILARKDIEVKKLLEVNSGSLIELNKLVDEPVDIYINGKLLARGEIISKDENFGVRVTDILKPLERLEKLK